MQSQSDAKLKEIVTTRRSDYQPDAITAAEYVLQQRNVSFEIPPPETEIKKVRNPILAIARGIMGAVVILFLVGFLGKKLELKPGVIAIGSLALLCAIWFFFGIRKGRK